MTLKNIYKPFKRILDYADGWATVYLFAMIIPNVILDITEPICLPGKVANILVPFAIYLLLLSKVKRPGALMLWLSIMMVMNSFQIVIFYLYGESIIAIDMLLNCVTSNPEEAGELLSNLLFPIIIDSIIYIPLIIWGIYSLVKKPSLRTTASFRSRGKKIGLLTLLAGILFAAWATAVSPQYTVARQLYPFNVISNIGSALGRIIQSARYETTSKDFKYDAVTTLDDSQPFVAVLVIGETSRAENWSLFGYKRETNPKLSARNDLYLFPKAVSQSNTTHKCVPLMLSPVNPEQFDSIRYVKSMITAFKESGFDTAFYSNQSKNHSYTQFFSEEADTVYYLDAKHHYDHYLAALLKDFLAKSTNPHKLIVLHSYGSHFNYRDRYGKEFSHFKPDNSTTANVKHRATLLNAYDNSIRYTDNYLNEVLNVVDSLDVPSFVLFSSDHGEDIFDDERERFLHASPTATYWQLHVPMFLWLSPEYSEGYPNVGEYLSNNSGKYVAPSQSVFHTMLNLAGINTVYRNDSNSVASPLFTSPKPVYLDDYNESIPLESSGIKANDIEHFKALGIL